MLYEPEDKPTSTFVLVHGGQHGGWCWRRVAERLRRRGAQVFAPTLTGTGERAHLLTPTVSLETMIQDVINVLECEELQDVILVGHSFGGMPISAAADRVPERIGHLVYLDAVVPDDGESAAEQISDEVFRPWLNMAEEQTGGIALPIHFTPADLGVTDPGDAAWIARRLTPHPTRGYTDKVHLDNPVGNSLPVTYIACNQDLGLNPSRERAQDRGWDYVSLDSGHNAMMIAPDDLTALLTEIASSVNGTRVAGSWPQRIR